MAKLNQVSEDNPFWNFSLEFYGWAGVADACLELQDNFGVDVNIVLYCCWLAVDRAEKLERAELVEIISAIEPWQNGVVQQLRAIRREMKQNEVINFGALSEELRQAIKKCELDGEKIEQSILYQSGQEGLASAPPDNPDNPNSNVDSVEQAKIAELNMTSYLAVVCDDLPDSGRNIIRTLSQALES